MIDKNKPKIKPLPKHGHIFTDFNENNLSDEDKKLREDILMGKVTPILDKEILLKSYIVEPGKTRYVLTNNGIYKQTFRSEINNSKLERIPFWETTDVIFHGKYIPLQKLIIDDRVLFKFKTYKEQILTMKDIVNLLKNEGGILNKSKIDDAVNAVSLNLEVIKGHGTYGVYLNKQGKMELCLDAMPYKDTQIRTHDRIKGLDFKITKNNLQTYFDFVKHFHLYEYFPSMCGGIMGPFTLLFRSKGKMLMVIWHYANKSHLGKSLVLKTFSTQLFGIYDHGGDELKTPFRLLEVVDSICGFVTTHEVDNVKWNDMLDIIKHHAESYSLSSRGTGNLKSNEYLSRALLGFSSNRFKVKDKQGLNRIMKIEFDVTKESERSKLENSDIVDSIYNNLEPIGWELVKNVLEYVEYDLHKLIDNINKHTAEIKKHFSKFIDPRRQFHYGASYEFGLAWDRLSKLYGCDWRIPSYEEYVEKVIKVIEQSTKKTGKLPIADFANWWESWKARKRRSVKHECVDGNCVMMDEIEGQGTIWIPKTIKYQGKEYQGDVITDAILREYQQDRNYQIDSLADIKDEIRSITGIPTKHIYKSFYFGTDVNGKQINIHGVFIPHNIFRYGVVKAQWKELCESNQQELENEDVYEEESNPEEIEDEIVRSIEEWEPNKAKKKQDDIDWDFDL